MLIGDVARSSSDGVAIHYVLPVLWMTSYFHTTRPMGRNQMLRNGWQALSIFGLYWCNWRYVALVVVLWLSSSASVTALRWEPVNAHV